MKRASAVIAIASVLALAAIAGQRLAGSGSETAATESQTFTTLNIYLDTGAQPLAAYQFDLKSRDPRVKIVGIEGGRHAAFQNPPYYDPAAIEGDRVIAAAFSLNAPAELPTGRTRIVTLHLLAPAEIDLEYDIDLTVAADHDAQPIPAEISLVKGNAP